MTVTVTQNTLNGKGSASVYHRDEYCGKLFQAKWLVTITVEQAQELKLWPCRECKPLDRSPAALSPDGD